MENGKPKDTFSMYNCEYSHLSTGLPNFCENLILFPSSISISTSHRFFVDFIAAYQHSFDFQAVCKQKRLESQSEIDYLRVFYFPLSIFNSQLH